MHSGKGAKKARKQAEQAADEARKEAEMLKAENKRRKEAEGRFHVRQMRARLGGGFFSSGRDADYKLG